MKDNYSIIMAGGIGSRFWPMSVPERPKQFLDILGIGKSLIQMTYERLLHVCPEENIYVVTNTQYKEMVLEQIPALKPEQVLTEPERKNTAPCIAYAAAKIHSINENSNLIISPADHLIIQEQNFKGSIETAINTASRGKIVTIGIQPTRPDTGYGYIEVEQNSEVKANDVMVVQQFREKPSLEKANEFLAAGNFYWNSGIFIWKSSTVLEALKTFQPSLFKLFGANLEMYKGEDEQEQVNHAFSVCEDISIDFAVMEHAKNIEIVLANFDWSDLGTWGSLDLHLNKDKANNALVGKNVHTFNSKNCIINIPNGKTAVIDGLDGYIVIQYEDKLMILQKENEQELKKYLSTLR